MDVVAKDAELDEQVGRPPADVRAMLSDTERAVVATRGGRQRAGRDGQDDRDEQEEDGEEPRPLPSADRARFLSALAAVASAAGAEHHHGDDDAAAPVRDYALRATPLAAAAVSACIAIEDAAAFCAEARGMQQAMRLNDTLAFLYLTVTAEIGLPLRDARGDRDPAMVALIDAAVGSRFEGHPDQSVLLAAGITEGRLAHWLVGNLDRERRHLTTAAAAVDSALTRVWSAMFLRDLLRDPDAVDLLAQRYGTQRTHALDLAETTAARCGNLRNFCRVSILLLLLLLFV